MGGQRRSTVRRKRPVTVERRDLRIAPCGASRREENGYARPARYAPAGGRLAIRFTLFALALVAPVASALDPFPVPGGISPGPDEDGDGIPAAVLVAMRRVSVAPDGSLRVEDARPFSVPVDPDDRDAATPRPHPVVHPWEVTPFCGALDRICWGVEAPPLASVRGLVEVDVLPLTAGPLPSGEVMPGPDADGDGLPEHVDVGMRTWTWEDDGSVRWTPDAPRRIVFTIEDG